jgi:hypothetical protein
MNTLKSLMLLLLSASIIGGCREKIEGDLGGPYDKVKGMEGTWELTRFSQIDLNNPVLEERDLSEFFLVEGVTPLRLTFNGSDNSYSVQITEGKNYFGDGGTWSFDDPQYPSYLLLNDGLKEIEFELGRVVREFDTTLELDLRRGCGSDGTLTETVIYHFEFLRK